MTSPMIELTSAKSSSATLSTGIANAESCKNSTSRKNVTRERDKAAILQKPIDSVSNSPRKVFQIVEIYSINVVLYSFEF
mmetsp:Transcript_16078/g.37275  ORF Transcript_16078/g.37275 Transcript_16078/m.37275 type:complete len:80 (-) Transcript_16078:167-406(-)